jgi:hypothetical protein
VGGQKRSTVLIAAIVAEGIVNNIRDCKTHYVNEKGAGRRKSGPPLNLLAVTFLLAWDQWFLERARQSARGRPPVPSLGDDGAGL